MVPDSIFENGRTGDWVASLTLSDAAGALDVALTGTGAKFFEAKLDHATGAVTILPTMIFDREAYAAGADPVFQFGLSVRFPGGWQDLGQTWSVTLEGIDDAPPRRLAWVNGGTVLENDIGASIGLFLGSDPDSPTSTLTYRVVWPDEAQFEVVDGRTLKLRDGVDLLREGGTVRQVMIEVSDGKQEATFLLDVTVLGSVGNFV
jgi:hypothetical protein